MIINAIYIFLLFIVLMISKCFSNKDTSISNSLFSSGIILILSGVPQIDEAFFMIIAGLFKSEISGNEGPYWLRCAIGMVLIVLGIILSRRSTYILNMHGLFVQKDIDYPPYLKKLKLSKHKIKEQIVDFVDVFKSQNKMDKVRNGIICNTIEKSANRFSALNSENKSACFTGMAPIPYTVLAGTYLGDAHINRYFEYNSKEDSYYELKKYCLTNKWDKLKLHLPEAIKTDAKEVLLAISITHAISNNDLSQFGLDVVHLSLDEPCDNVIIYKAQLDDYRDTIFKYIENELMDTYFQLETIHIVASIPSCISLEIGKCFAFRTNRLCDIIVYHYESSANPKYTFGIYVLGDKKGMLVINGE